MPDGLAGRGGAARPVLPGLAAGQPRTIILWPDPRLSQPCEPAGVLDAPALRGLVADLFATMAMAQAASLSAPQIGICHRVFVAEMAELPGGPIAFIDPEILWRSDETAVTAERSLSRPDRVFDIARAAAVDLGWYDLDGRYLQLRLEGEAAGMVQQQVDQLDGQMNSEV